MKLQLSIKWWNADDRKMPIDDEDRANLQAAGIEIAGTMIADGYRSGALLDIVTEREDGVRYRGWWDLSEEKELAAPPAGWVVMPEDLISHRNDWLGACKIALANVNSDDAMVYQDLRDYWQNRIYLLNNIDYKLGRPGFDKADLSLPSGWDVAPIELKSNLEAWKQACAIAVEKAPGLDTETYEDDKSYWQKQVSVLARIENLLTAEQSTVA